MVLIVLLFGLNLDEYSLPTALPKSCFNPSKWHSSVFSPIQKAKALYFELRVE